MSRLTSIKNGINVLVNENESFDITFSDRKLLNRLSLVGRSINEIIELVKYEDEYVELLADHVVTRKFEPVLNSVDKFIDISQRYINSISAEIHFYYLLKNKKIEEEDLCSIKNYMEKRGIVKVKEYIELVKELKYKPNKLEIENMRRIIKKYNPKNKVNFWGFVNKSKRSATSILFTENEIEKIFLLSALMKLYTPFTKGNHRMTSKNEKMLYAKIESKLNMNATVGKIYNLVKSRVFKFTIDDVLMWQLFKLRSQMNEYTFILRLFNHIINYLMATFDLKSNPIVYITVFITDNTKWYLKGLYNLKQSFNDEIGFSDNIGTYYNGLSNVVIYQDLLSKIRSYVYEKMRVKGVDLTQWTDELDYSKYDYSFIESFVIPVICNILDIKNGSFFYLLSVSDKILLQLFLHFILVEYNGETDLTKILRCLVNKSTTKINLNDYKSYKIININGIIDEDFKCYGCNNKLMLNIYFSYIMSNLKGSSLKMVFGDKVSKNVLNLANLELEVISFTKVILSNKITDAMVEMKELVLNRLREL